MSRDPRRATELAAELDGWNRERQTEEARVVEEARRAVLGARSRCRRSWWPGARSGTRAWSGSPPAASPRSCTGRRCCSSVEGELATGSGRSVPGLELHRFLAAWKDGMERFGGHAQAVGLTVRLDRLEELRQRVGGGRPRAGRESLLARPARVRAAPGAAADLDRAAARARAARSPTARAIRGRWCAPARCGSTARRALFGSGHLSARTRGDGRRHGRAVGWGWQGRAADLDGALRGARLPGAAIPTAAAPVLRLRGCARAGLDDRRDEVRRRIASS